MPATELESVEDFVAATRTLLQDNAVAYQYSDADIVLALNMGVQEMHRIRPDIFFLELGDFNIDSYDPGSMGQDVSVNSRYRQALLYYMAGWLQLNLGVGNNDDRAGAFMKLFRAQLLGEA